MKIAFLLNNAYGIGGTIRSVANLSGGLAARGHQVRVTSLYRHRDTTSFAFGPRVPIDTLIDQRPGSRDLELPEASAPSERLPHWRRGVSLLSDRRMADHLATLDADVVVSTRPTLSHYLGTLGAGRPYLRVGQEHSTLGRRHSAARRLQLSSVPLLDAFAPVSDADTAAYRAALPAVAERIVWIPNSSVPPAVAPSNGDSRVIVAAGRLVDQKRYDRLLDAFAQLTDEFPDWRLRIYGRGPLRDELRARVEHLGLWDRARLMGAVSPIETEWAKGSIAAVTSWWESFGLTIVEAMACGVPVVSTDCPTGPAEIITPGKDGLLVPEDGGPDAIAHGLRTLMVDDALRHRMGAAALETAKRYTPDVIARRYEELFARLGPRTRPARRGRLRRLLAGLRATPHAPAAKAMGQPPAAHAVARRDGALAVRVEPAARGDLVLRLRGAAKRTEVLVPLDRDGRTVITRDEHDLAEGRWDAFLAIAGPRRPRRVAARLVERAALVTARPAVAAGGVSVWIPYTTKDGNLTLRVWRRPAHAAVESVEITEEATAVTVTPLPAATTVTGAAARAEGGAPLALPVEPDGEGRLRIVLRHTLAARLAAAPAWRLRLTVPEEPPVPLGRLAGDTPDRRRTDVHPAIRRDGVELRLAFTIDNELTLVTAPSTTSA
ncbi:glycosyltransferase family 4 protein [Streptomyces sp. 8K308]|uniref:glycosyltransferase family 4 protein n=1 Tax=Streptomyces sp. 8K308 TaxID=2530388 RepID=UPI001049827F|nr:glycosyltransferase family 4 protein [Streptomyces sp. 8K308]TDC25097.1 glycosyltransferase family 4 protein [Streptomyces sp. 8K308]